MGHVVHYRIITPSRAESIERWQWRDDKEAMLRKCNGDGAMTQ